MQVTAGGGCLAPVSVEIYLATAPGASDQQSGAAHLAWAMRQTFKRESNTSILFNEELMEDQYQQSIIFKHGKKVLKTLTSSLILLKSWSWLRAGVAAPPIYLSQVRLELNN